jgi:hypothetical protein
MLKDKLKSYYKLRLEYFHKSGQVRILRRYVVEVNYLKVRLERAALAQANVQVTMIRMHLYKYWYEAASVVDGNGRRAEQQIGPRLACYIIGEASGRYDDVSA